ncbi:hypothetical protein EJB05_42056, partial [Eragrostis curvula]
MATGDTGEMRRGGGRGGARTAGGEAAAQRRPPRRPAAHCCAFPGGDSHSTTAPTRTAPAWPRRPTRCHPKSMKLVANVEQSHHQQARRDAASSICCAVPSAELPMDSGSFPSCASCCARRRQQRGEEEGVAAEDGLLGLHGTALGHTGAKGEGGGAARARWGIDEEMELDSKAPPTKRLRLSFEEVPGSTAIPGLKPAGAVMYDYEVTADDFDTVLAVECVPMDDNGLQGDMVTEFANGKNKIACDSDMQSEIDAHISNEAAQFSVFTTRKFLFEEWEPAAMMLTGTGYKIVLESADEVVIEEEYSRALELKVPIGRTTQFGLVSSGGVTLPFKTSGRESEDYDLRLRDLVVLALTLDSKEQGES